MSRAPEAPSGWPSAIAPPRGLSLLEVGVEVRRARPAAPGAKASLTSIVVEVVDRHARRAPEPSRSPGSGRSASVIGSSEATANAWKRARGVRPSCAARSSLMISRAAAPSVSCEELPAVICQSISGKRSRHLVGRRRPASARPASPTVVPRADRLVGVDDDRRSRRAGHSDRDDLAARRRRPRPRWCERAE